MLEPGGRSGVCITIVGGITLVGRGDVMPPSPAVALLMSCWAAGVSAVISSLIASALVSMFSPSLRSP